MHLHLYLLFYHSAYSQNKPVALSLSGGGARGFAHLGVLKAIEKFKIDIIGISGTSIGSVIGGMYAGGYSVEEIETFIKEFCNCPMLYLVTIHVKTYLSNINSKRILI